MNTLKSLSIAACALVAGCTVHGSSPPTVEAAADAAIMSEAPAAPVAGPASAAMPEGPVAAAPTAGASQDLWATNYYVHLASAVETGVPLLDMNEKPLGFNLPAKEWCLAAIEGTVGIQAGSNFSVLNYAGTGPTALTDCKPFVAAASRDKPWVAAIARTRWAAVNAPFGLGVKSYKLVPYRTVAVDPTVFAYGTVLFIPAAVGIVVDDGTGKTFTHDGYFFAADTGGAIKGNHIDVFTGLQKNPGLAFVKSKPSATFKAQVVTDPAVIAKLKAMHV